MCIVVLDLVLIILIILGRYLVPIAGDISSEVDSLLLAIGRVCTSLDLGVGAQRK